jgi:hypothetical protein
MKICIRCKKNKTLQDFENHPTSSDGKRNQCSSCRYKLRVEREGASAKRKQKHWNLGRYGISIDEWEQQLKKQNNLCAICKKFFTDKDKPHTDHNHETGLFRGILCSQCNTGIGLLGDDPERIRAAAQYLDATRSQVL